MEPPEEPGITAPLFDPAALSALPVRCTGLGDRCGCPPCTAERQEVLDRDAAERRRRAARREGEYDLIEADDRPRATGPATRDEAMRRRAEHERDRAITRARWAKWCRAAIQMYGKGTPWAVRPAHRTPSEER